MRTVLAYPGNMAEAQHSALALAEAGALQAFVTTFAYRRDGVLDRALRHMPAPAQRLSRELARRAVDAVPAHLVRTHPGWELMRTAAAKAGAGPVLVDRLWERMSHSFDARVARRYVADAQAVEAFEYTALHTFERAEAEGVARVLHVPSLDSLQFETILRRERQQWPELATTQDAYFDRRFEQRYERRRREIALADVIVANSTLTAQSHIDAGADPAKVFAVPYAAPPPIAAAPDDDSGGSRRPLTVLWAGSFSVRKGAHYLLEAWRLLRAGGHARLHVYGQPLLSSLQGDAAPDGVIFHGSVAHPVLFAAYRAADVLVFPTLSDGFGQVVTEAMANALPVITTDRAGAADLVTPDNGLIVPAADARALADALRWCLDNRQRLQAMRAHALGTARRRQWPQYRRDLIAALEQGLRRAGYSPSFATPAPSAATVQ